MMKENWLHIELANQSLHHSDHLKWCQWPWKTRMFACANFMKILSLLWLGLQKWFQHFLKQLRIFCLALFAVSECRVHGQRLFRVWSWKTNRWIFCQNEWRSLSFLLPMGNSWWQSKKGVDQLHNSWCQGRSHSVMYK